MLTMSTTLLSVALIPILAGRAADYSATQCCLVSAVAPKKQEQSSNAEKRKKKRNSKRLQLGPKLVRFH